MLLAMLDLRGEENVRIRGITLTKARSQPRTTSVVWNNHSWNSVRWALFFDSRSKIGIALG